jgi:hypothetical protein
MQGKISKIPLTRKSHVLHAIVIASLLFFAMACVILIFLPISISRYFFFTQDLPVVMLFVVMCGALVFGRHYVVSPVNWQRLSLLQAAAIIVGLILLLWLGTYIVMENYPLSRDEDMAVFDSIIFRSGHLVAAIVPQWRSYAGALEPTPFLLDLPGDGFWVSAYMPVNAAMRAGFMLIGDAGLMNPVLAGVGALALMQVAKRAFPEDVTAQRVALLLYLTSTQMMAAAMTPYAMTGHMALNLIWLALFLRRDSMGHAGAIAVGFMATGLHQIIFHPLFALPFIDRLRVERRWRTLALYLVAYAVIGLFWISYQGWLAGALGLTTTSGATAGTSGFISTRILSLFRLPDLAGIMFMLGNLLRFATWQNLALPPLLAMAVPIARRGDWIAGSLCVGPVLTLVAMLILLPYQGHGWGYRYLHGFLGSVALLGAYGWRQVADRRMADTLIVVGTIATLGLATPFLLWRAHEFAHPYAAMSETISRTDADFVVVDTAKNDFAIDTVRNEPFLTNHPLRFASSGMTAPLLVHLCEIGSVRFVGLGGDKGIEPISSGHAEGGIAIGWLHC